SRHYVQPAVHARLVALGDAMAKRDTGAVVYYLDAGFPFGFDLPMLPHLSHRDGRAIDLAFAYQTETNIGFAPSPPPSPIRYLGYEAAAPEERHPCAGVIAPWRWDLPWLQTWFDGVALDPDRTRAMIAWLLAEDGRAPVRRIFLEPHL